MSEIECCPRELAPEDHACEDTCRPPGHVCDASDGACFPACTFCQYCPGTCDWCGLSLCRHAYDVQQCDSVGHWPERCTAYNRSYHREKVGES